MEIRKLNRRRDKTDGIFVIKRVEAAEQLSTLELHYRNVRVKLTMSMEASRSCTEKKKRRGRKEEEEDKPTQSKHV